MKNYDRLKSTSQHRVDVEDGRSLADTPGLVNWGVKMTDEVLQLNNILNNPNCKTIIIGERRGGNPGLVNIGGEINPYSYYEWHSLFPRPVIIENTPLDQSTWFRSIAALGTRDNTYTAYVSTRYHKAFFLNGHFILLEPKFNDRGEIAGGMRVSIQTIKRKNLHLWEILLEQQSDSQEIFAHDDYLSDTSQDIFNWSGDDGLQ